jgi:ABC-type lipoprotein export system ATPase subunit
VSDYSILLDRIEVVLPNQRKLFSLSRWEVPQGSHILVQGPSGAGKTTLLHLIAGLFLASSGEVKIGERNLKLLSDDARADLRREQIGVIFQKLNLLDHLTVSENIQLVSRNLASSEALSSVAESIDRVKLSGRNDERCAHLSLGEQQRVAVARVLHQRPNILLADEPTSSLDDRNADFIIQAIKEASKNKTLIVVSHDQRLAKHFDHVVKFGELTK